MTEHRGGFYCTHDGSRKSAKAILLMERRERARRSHVFWHLLPRYDRALNALKGHMQ